MTKKEFAMFVGISLGLVLVMALMIFGVNRNISSQTLIGILASTSPLPMFIGVVLTARLSTKKES